MMEERNGPQANKCVINLLKQKFIVTGRNALEVVRLGKAACFGPRLRRARERLEQQLVASTMPSA